MTGDDDKGLGAAADVIVERGGLRLVSRLGQGGMADLFLGVQKGEQGFARLVVVKKIKAQKLSERHLLGMFFDEAKTVAALSHPHIVKVYDLTRTDGKDGSGDVAIVMEYVDGETLSYVWKQLAKNKTHMPVPIVVKLILDAAEALGAAHGATGSDGKALQLIHRDVSPQNLMIDRNGYLKVIDFGIAKSTQQTELTSPGGIKGKLSYLAPETFRTRDIDARVDVYGLGLVLWELLTNKPGIDIAPDAPLQEVVDTVDNLKLAPPSTLHAEVPVELDEVVAMATAADRAQRYASMDDFAAALRKATTKSGVSSSAGVKKWFNATFAHRIEKRRAFEQDALARAEKPAATTTTTSTASGLPTARVDTVEHSGKALAPPLDAKPPAPTPLTEVRTPPPPSSKAPIYAAAAVGLVLVAVLVVKLWPAPAAVVVDVVDAGARVAVAVVDAGVAISTTQVVELPEPTPPSTTTSAPPKKTTPTKKTATTTTKPPEPTPEPTPEAPPPAPVTTTPAPVTTTTTTPATPSTPSTAAPQKKLYSGNGSWSGTQVLNQGCTKCHAVDAKAKTKRQWERFFERDVHDRHARLDDVFSDGEQQRALASLLLLLDGHANNSGVAGVR